LLPALVNCVRTALLAEANKPAAPTPPTPDNAMRSDTERPLSVS